jgi:hypothetical protein
MHSIIYCRSFSHYIRLLILYKLGRKYYGIAKRSVPSVVVIVGCFLQL